MQDVPASALLDRRLLAVTGKGGTGKSTVTAALALAASRRGKKVLVCEVVIKERVADLFGKPPSGPEIRQLLPNLFSVHVRPRDAMREYALMILKYETLYKLAFENAAARYFLSAAPSLAEIVMLGKVWWHATQEQERGRPRWDLVILDAPATGHGLTFLTVPEVFLQLVQDGPLARDMQALLGDPKTCRTCIVTLPEEMPANEAVELHRALKAHALPQGPVFLNGCFEPRFTAQERVAVVRGGPALAAAGEAADNHEARADLTRLYEGVLRERLAPLDQPLVKIPFLFDRVFGAQSIEKVAAAIEPAL